MYRETKSLVKAANHVALNSQPNRGIAGHKFSFS